MSKPGNHEDRGLQRILRSGLRVVVCDLCGRRNHLESKWKICSGGGLWQAVLRNGGPI